MSFVIKGIMINKINIDPANRYKYNSLNSVTELIFDNLKAQL